MRYGGILRTSFLALNENKHNHFKFIGTELAKFGMSIVGFMAARFVKPTFFMFWPAIQLSGQSNTKSILRPFSLAIH